MVTLYLPIFHMTPLTTTLSKVWWGSKPQNLRPHLKMKKKNLKQRFLKKWLKFEMIITSYGLSGFDLKSGHLNSEKEEALDLQDGKKSLWKIIMDSISFLFIQLEIYSIHSSSEKIIKVKWTFICWLYIYNQKGIKIKYQLFFW